MPEEAAPSTTTIDGDDPRASVAFDDSLRLSPEYVLRIARLTEEINQLLNGQRRPSTTEAIDLTLGAIVANLLRAAFIGDHIFLAVRLRSGAYTASQYANQGIGYRPMKRIIDYLKFSAGCLHRAPNRLYPSCIRRFLLHQNTINSTP
jgi:hypothetical protein